MGKSRQKVKAQKECFTCLYNQAKVWSKSVGEEYLATILRDKNGNSPSLTPPHIAITLYEKLALNQGVKDLYKQIKQECIAKAYEITKGVDVQELNLKEGIEFGALGNVIDYGSASNFQINGFDFQKEREKLEFACFDFLEFQKRAQKAKTTLIIADNAGENLFDEILIQTLKTHFPSMSFYYFLRGEPIINDLTLQDLDNPYSQRIFSLAQVVSSGVRSPSFIYEHSTPQAQEIYNQADLIIAKGMGNFECMEEHKDPRVFFLFKIKCQVVANWLSLPLGKMVFKQNL